MRITKNIKKVKEIFYFILIVLLVIGLVLVGFNWEQIQLYVNSLMAKKFSKNNQVITKMLETYKQKYYKPKGLKISGKLDNDIANWILLKEGGLTSNKNDSASSYPLKGTYTVAGKTYVDPHTNKGITYRTYLDSAKVVGYTPSAKQFLYLPNDIVFKIYKLQYADKFKENSGNDMIDHMLGLWAWGSGVGGEKLLVQEFEKSNGKTLNQLYKEDKDLLFKNLILYRIKFYERLAEKKPQNKEFLFGWINSALNFYESFKSYL